MMRDSMLRPWILGNESITPKNFYSHSDLKLEFGGFLGIDGYVELFEANKFDCGSLKESWNRTREYIENAYEILGRKLEDKEVDLDREEKYMILQKQGMPPFASYNIYIITIYNEIEERVVYIGKTDAKGNRFANGHLAALKLHNPIYAEYKKRVYFGTVVFIDENKDYLPLEYIRPLEKARNLLSSVEKVLIQYFKPELNIQDMHSELSMRPFQIHIQNFTDKSPFLNDIYAC